MAAAAKLDGIGANSVPQVEIAIYLPFRGLNPETCIKIRQHAALDSHLSILAFCSR